MKKRLTALLLAFTLVLSLAACGKEAEKPAEAPAAPAAEDSDNVCLSLTGIAPETEVMTVNGASIPMDLYFYAITYACDYLNGAMQNYYGTATLDWSLDVDTNLTALDFVRANLLENVKFFAVVEQLAAEQGITVDAAAQETLDGQRSSYVESVGGEEAFLKELGLMGLREETFDRLNRIDYFSSALTEMTEDPGSALYPTDEKLAELAEAQGYMTADHILFSIRDSITSETYDEAKCAEQRKLAEDVLAQLRAYTGDDLAGFFTSLADRYSEDPGHQTNPNGYTFGPGEMVTEFEEAAKALQPGELSGIVETDYGYHILLRKTTDPAGLDSLRSGYFNTLVASYIADAETTEDPALAELDIPTVYDAYLLLRPYPVLADEPDTANGSPDAANGG